MQDRDAARQKQADKLQPKKKKEERPAHTTKKARILSCQHECWEDMADLVCPFVCACVCVCVYIYIYIYIYMSVCMCVYIVMST